MSICSAPSLCSWYWCGSILPCRLSIPRLRAITWPLIPRLVSSIVAFMLFEAAYFSEIVRAGIQSIPKGQTACGLCTGHDLPVNPCVWWFCRKPSVKWHRCCYNKPLSCSKTPPWCMPLVYSIFSGPTTSVAILMSLSDPIYFICRLGVLHHQYASHICREKITKEVNVYDWPK